MRIGRNPARKAKRIQQHAEVTLATVVYIPFLSGYYEESLDVLKLCLGSLREHSDAPYELLVFDNGSCSEVRSFLAEELQEGRIDYLILSKENLGKAGAWNIMFPAAPGQIIGFCDSDIFFEPGWLSAHLRILRAFPNVGMVTGLPIRQQVNVFTERGLKKAEQHSDIMIERGDFITEGAMAAYCVGVDRNFVEYQHGVADMKDMRLTIGDTSALLGACHFQFIAYKSVLTSFVPFSAKILLDGSDKVAGSESELDRKIEDGEFLRLSTSKVYVHHLGNTVTPQWKPWMQRFAPSHLERASRDVRPWEQRLSQNRYVRGALMRLYNYVFRLYNVPTKARASRAPRARPI
jgi:glycosyltransferase involved in cell wall biosynthesis